LPRFVFGFVRCSLIVLSLSTLSQRKSGWREQVWHMDAPWISISGFHLFQCYIPLFFTSGIFVEGEAFNLCPCFHKFHELLYKKEWTWDHLNNFPRLAHLWSLRDVCDPRAYFYCHFLWASSVSLKVPKASAANLENLLLPTSSNWDLSQAWWKSCCSCCHSRRQLTYCKHYQHLTIET